MADPVLFGFLVSLGMGLGAFAFFLWAVMAGQMEDAEEVKYRIIQREEDDDSERQRIGNIHAGRRNEEFRNDERRR